MDEREKEIFISQTEAIRDFIVRSTAPFIIQVGEGKSELFTGTLMCFENRHFIISAGHPFFETMGQDVKIFARMSPANNEFVTIGPCEVSVPSSPDVDVGIVELHDLDTIRLFESNYTFLTLANVTKTLRNSSTVIVGYPVAKAWENSKKEFDPKPLFIKTELLEKDPPPEVKRIPGLDYFFLFDKIANDLNLDSIETVDLPGISGAAVWQYRKNEDMFWAPSKSFKIIGIQVSVADSKSFLRVINWWAVAQSLKNIDPKLEAVLKEYLTDGAD